MQTFSAEEFNKQPAKVYRAADLEGEVKINNSRYADKMFVLIARQRASDIEVTTEMIETATT